jgi:hypothetical protein
MSFYDKWMGVAFKNIDDSKVDEIATKFFQQNYSSIDIQDKILKNDIWIVKALVSSFGQQSIRTLSIETKYGRIIGCE